MNKKVEFKIPVQLGPEDAWVSKPSIENPPTPQEPMKRFTIDVTEELHKRIKTQCAMRGEKMADVIREILENEFPH